MELNQQIQQIDALIAILGDNRALARPEEERAVLNLIRQLLEQTRELRTTTNSEIWVTYLPYAARLCLQLSKLEEGWIEDLEYFSSENGQFWLDYATALLDRGDIERVQVALANVIVATRIMSHDRITQVVLLLQGIDIALEINDKKQATGLFEEANQIYRKHLTESDAYSGSGWLRKIKKMGQQLAHFQEKLHRYYAYSSAVIFSLEADNAEDLQRVVDYLQQNLAGKIKVTRKVKESEANRPGSARFKVRLKINLE